MSALTDSMARGRIKPHTHYQRRRTINAIMLGLTGFFTLLALIPLIWIIVYVIQTGGTLTTTDQLHIGEGGSSGDWQMTGGNIVCGGWNFSIGEGGNGTMSITGNSTLTTTSGELWVGNGGSGDERDGGGDTEDPLEGGVPAS